MAEVSALRKHPCPECGGDAEWNASKQALACPYCGTVLPWTPGEPPFGAGIEEHDLLDALHDAERNEAPSGDAGKSVKCGSCHAITQFNPDRAAQRCDFCGSPSIVPVDDMRDAVTPGSLLPAGLSSTQVRDSVRQWYGNRWWAPNKLKRSALTDTLHGIYLPYWTFDAHVDADWTADAGYYYYESRRVRDSNGNTRTEQVRKIRWESCSGHLAHFFDDVLVAGTVGVHPELLRKVEPFPTVSDLKPYDPAYIRGWTVERYQVDLRKASETGKLIMEETIRSLCSREVPGDTQRNLQVRAIHRGRTFKHILVPVWLVSYDYGRKSYQIIVNGYTGKIAGEHPLSWIKITLAVLAALIVILLFYQLNQG